MFFSKLKSFFGGLINRFKLHPTWGFIGAILIALVNNIGAVIYTVSLQHDLQAMYARDLYGQNYIQAARINLHLIDKELVALFLLKSDVALDSAVMRIHTDAHVLQGLVDKSKSFFHSKKGKTLWVNTNKAFGRYTLTIDTLVDLSRNAQKEKAIGFVQGVLRERFGHLDTLLAGLDNIKIRHDIGIYKRIDYELSISIVFTLIVLLLAIGTRVYIFRKQTR
ncbi:MAG: hypothetical protein PHC61_12270 [Chitinivibrionales bacterium]|nr:hypothetical protein [Chitinivibrionales bacterium]